MAIQAHSLILIIFIFLLNSFYTRAREIDKRETDRGQETVDNSRKATPWLEDFRNSLFGNMLSTDLFVSFGSWLDRDVAALSPHKYPRLCRVQERAKATPIESYRQK